MTFFFYKSGGRREKAERMHDLLVAAKDGLKRTRIMYLANLSWNPTVALLKSAEAAGLIEEIMIPHYEEYGRKKPTLVWKTTEKGLRYAKGVYENAKPFREAEE